MDWELFRDLLSFERGPVFGFWSLLLSSWFGFEFWFNWEGFVSCFFH
jgi:hypothetical protein